MTSVWDGHTEYRFYWGREIANFGDQGLARQRLELYWSLPGASERLRSLLWRTSGERLKDDEVMKRASQMLQTGELVTGYYGPVDALWRLPIPAEDRDFANQFLRSFQRDPLVMETFRGMYRSRFSTHDALRVRDEVVIAGLASLMTLGELVVGMRLPPPGSHTQSDKTKAAPPPPGPSAASGSGSREEEPDPSMNLAASQAAALLAAAQNGAPFCPI